MNMNPKDIVRELVDRVGKREARRLLVISMVAPDTAAKLVNGRYQSEVGDLLGGAIGRANESSKQAAS